MNSVLEVLYLRRPKIDYISPPICLDFVPASSSGSFVVVEAASAPAAPEIFYLDSTCHRFFTWDLPAKYFCASVYLSDTETDPLVLAADCVQNYWYSFCSPGWWKVVALVAGTESSASEPMVCDGTSPIRVQIPRPAGVTGWRIYKNPVYTDENAQYYSILDTTRTALVEVCEGCYRIRVVTKEGHTELSNMLCVDNARLDPACCTQVPCPFPLAWDPGLCSCTTDVSDIVGPEENFCVGTPYASQFTAVGGSSPFTWTLISGSFPPGLLFSGITLGISNPLTGTPTTSGSYTFTVRAMSKNGIFVDKTFAMVGGGVDEYPTLPAGTTDTAYSEQLTASSPDLPITFQVISGSLPYGLSMSAAGLISGTPSFPETLSFTVRVTDNAGRVCDTPLSITIGDCPVAASHPTISDWSPSFPDKQFAALDQARRRLWITHPYYHAAPLGPPYPQPYQIISIVDTAAKSFLQYATDTNGYVSTPATGDFQNGICEIFYDSKYDQMVACGNQARVILYDANTMNCQGAVGPIANLGYGYANQLYWPQNPYDRNRGYVYLVTKGQPMSVRIFDLNPALPGIVGAAYPGDGRQGVDPSFDPIRDRLYIGDYTGTKSFHIWDPVTHAFSYQQGPTSTGTCRGLRYIPGLDRLLIAYSDNKWSVVNPGDNTVDATFASGAGLPLAWVDYSPCNGLIYAGAGVADAGIESIDTLNGYATAAVDFTHTAYSFLVDTSANLLFSSDFSGHLIRTY